MAGFSWGGGRGGRPTDTGGMLEEALVLLPAGTLLVSVGGQDGAMGKECSAEKSLIPGWDMLSRRVW